MKRICVLLVLMLLVGCAGQVQPQREEAQMRVSGNSQPDASRVKEVTQLIYSLDDNSTEYEYQAAEKAFKSLSYSDRSGLVEAQAKLDSIKILLDQKRDQKIVNEFIELIDEMHEIIDAIHIDDETMRLYTALRDKQKGLSRSQRELVPEDATKKYVSIVTAIMNLNHEERLRETTVVISATGAMYHLPSCYTLQYAGTEMTAAQAIAHGYPACSECNPPKSVENTIFFLNGAY